MARARSTAAVLPALLPGLLVVVLGFEAGGFYPDTWAPLALLLAVALAVRVSIAERPFAGVSAWSGVAAGALALLGAWMLLSASWSDAPGRAVIEFVRLLLTCWCCWSAPRWPRARSGWRGGSAAWRWRSRRSASPGWCRGCAPTCSARRACRPRGWTSRSPTGTGWASSPPSA